MALTETLVAHKLQVAVAGLVVLGGGGAAAYVAMGGGLPFLNDSPAPIDQVPADVDAVVMMDADVGGDETTKALVDGLLQLDFNESDGDDDGPDSYDEWVSEGLSDGADLDPSKLDRAVAFGAYPGELSLGLTGGSSNDSYGAVIYESSWAESDFVDAIQNETDYEEQSYEGYTVYVKTAASDDETDWGADTETPAWIGVLGDGRYVTGTEAAVTDTIDVDRGAADSFGGELRSEYEATREDGYLRFAMSLREDDLPETNDSGFGMGAATGMAGTGMSGTGVSGSGQAASGTAKNVSMLAGSYYTTDGNLGLNLRLKTTHEADPSDLATQWHAAEAGLANMTDRDVYLDLIDAIEVDEQGDHVIVTFESQPQALVDGVEQLVLDVRSFIENLSLGSSYGTGTSVNSTYADPSINGSLSDGIVNDSYSSDAGTVTTIAP